VSCGKKNEEEEEKKNEEEENKKKIDVVQLMRTISRLPKEVLLFYAWILLY
jgi:hypothetical protein